jgi:adenylate kinase family enzyme
MKLDAILLLGPTGSGKTPLGDFIAGQGFAGRRCAHFDFGARLRHAAEHGEAGLTPDDLAFIRRVLRGGALLENDTFYIAHTLLENFITRHALSGRHLVILNGLPRHAGQADAVGKTLSIILVIALECTAETTLERIAANSGGDRAGRTDDSVAEVIRKLETYAARTRPLLEYYSAAGTPCRTVQVGLNTVPEDILQAVDPESA